MSKGIYNATEFQDYREMNKIEQFEGNRLIVGIDIAKHKQYACLMSPGGWKEYEIVTFDAGQTKDFVAFLAALDCEVDVVLEPSGTYGDPLRAQCKKHDLYIWLARPKQVHDVAEVFDGVPSLHDAKAAYLICRLHQNGVTSSWHVPDETRRTIRAILERLDKAELERSRLSGKLEAMLSRYWPEAGEILGLDTATLQKVLAEFGGPAEVANNPHKAEALMRKVGGTFLSDDKIERLIESASTTRGMSMLKQEERTLSEFAARLYEVTAKKRREKRHLKELTEEDEEIASLSAQVGVTTSCVLVAYLGSVDDYEAASAYEKACGLNLKEKSSGKYVGQLKITKRGPSVVRRYLWLAALRMVTKHDGCPIARAWYQAMLSRNGDNRTKAIVALMRKLIGALYHIGQGAEYDGAMLFDVSRLSVQY